MKTTITINNTKNNLNQDQLQIIRRVANVLRMHNLDVEIAWEIPELITNYLQIEKIPPIGDKRL